MTGNSYNRKFGENANADRLLQIIELTREDFGRYRDTYLTDRGTTITVYTRMGGSSAPFFKEQRERLGMHRQIVGAWDDEHDNTYHYIKFLVPTDWLNETKRMFASQGEPRTVWQMFQDLNQEMRLMDRSEIERDPRFEHEINMLKDLHASDKKYIDTTDDDMPPELKPEFLR